AVEHEQVEGAGGGDGERVAGGEVLAARPRFGAEILDQVVQAHNEAGKARRLRGGGDLLDVENGERRLDHHQELEATRGAGFGDRFVEPADIIAAGDFRGEDGVGAGVGGGSQVRLAPFGVLAVDADDEFAR